jgi:hypothetical protein
VLLVTRVAGFEFFVGPLLRLIGLAQEEMVRAKWTRLFLTRRMLLILGSYQSGQMGLTVNQLSVDFGGSNPSLPTSN